MSNLMRLVVLTLMVGALASLVTPLAAQTDLRFETFTVQSDIEEITFTLNPGDASVLFYARSEDPLDNVLIVELIGPGGETLYAEDETTGDIMGDVFADLLISPHEVAMYLPPAPQFELEPGAYTVVALSESGSRLSEAGIVVRSGNVDGPQAIDFNLLVLTNSISSGSFEAIERELRNEMNSVLNPHNLQAGEFSFVEATAPQKQRFASAFFPEADLTDPILLEICSLMSETVGNTRALNVALVDFVGDDGTAGIASALPGTALVNDSPISCIIAALQGDTNFSTNTQGINILHESAHLMGLTHTTEEEGTFFDIFDDTAQCVASQFDANGDGIVDDTECQSVDGNNFMFWSEGGLQMSADQAWTFRRHPLFYPLPGRSDSTSDLSGPSVEKIINDAKII